MHAPRITPSMVAIIVTVVLVAIVGLGDRNDRVSVAVVQVFWRRWLVVVTIAVSNTYKTAGLCRIADPAVPGQCRIGGRLGATSPSPHSSRETQ